MSNVLSPLTRLTAMVITRFEALSEAKLIFDFPLS